MVLRLYYDLFSQPSRALYIFLKLTKIPFEPCVVRIAGGDLLSEEFKEKYSKFQKVPFIHHDDFRLTESVAILRYVAREFKIEDKWYPKNTRAQARVDEYLEWHHLNIRLFCSTFFLSKVFVPLKTGKEPPPERLQKHKKQMIKSLGDFEKLFLFEGNTFVTGSTISFADIQAACEIEQPRMAGYNPMEDFPKINEWIQRVKSECNPYYDEAHKIVNNLSDQAKENSKAKL